MVGRTRFPRIGELPYLLTLAGRGFFWFELRRTTRRDRLAERLGSTAARLADLIATSAPALVRRAGDGHQRTSRRRRPRCRCRGDEPRPRSRARAALRDGDARDATSSCSVPVRRRGRRRRSPRSTTASRTRRASPRSPADRRHRRRGHDARRLDGRVEFRWRRTETRRRRGRSTVRPLGRRAVEHVGGRRRALILKIYRRLEAGLNPELEMLLFLTEHDFAHVAAGSRGWYGVLGAHLAARDARHAASRSFPAPRDGWSLALDRGARVSRHVPATASRASASDRRRDALRARVPTSTTPPSPRRSRRPRRWACSPRPSRSRSTRPTRRSPTTTRDGHRRTGGGAA